MNRTFIEGRTIPKIKIRTEKTSADGGIWISPKVARWIEKEPEKKSPNQRRWDFLNREGISYSNQSFLRLFLVFFSFIADNFPNPHFFS